MKDNLNTRPRSGGSNCDAFYARKREKEENMTSALIFLPATDYFAEIKPWYQRLHRNIEPLTL